MTVSLLASKPDPGAEGNKGTTAVPLLSVSGLSVSYGPVRALVDINLDVRPGELVALAGENGAGKTTLVRCIAGDVVPAAGDIFLAGKRVPSDPAGAAKLGVAVVWQDLALCDNLDVAANILLGRESRRLMRSDTRFHGAAADLLTSLRIPLTDTTLRVGSLSGGQRQLVAVARAMGRRPRLLALARQACGCDNPIGRFSRSRTNQAKVDRACQRRCFRRYGIATWCPRPPRRRCFTSIATSFMR